MAAHAHAFERLVGFVGVLLKLEQFVALIEHLKNGTFATEPLSWEELPARSRNTQAAIAARLKSPRAAAMTPQPDR